MAITRMNKGHQVTACPTEILFLVKDLNQQCRTKCFRAWRQGGQAVTGFVLSPQRIYLPLLTMSECP